jgi:hypothetical protein
LAKIPAEANDYAGFLLQNRISNANDKTKQLSVLQSGVGSVEIY